jgi:hypothetical protein
MMSDIRCRYSGDREQAIVSFLYGDTADADLAERVVFEQHLATCERCRSELAAFEGVRTSLGRWASPEPAGLRWLPGDAMAAGRKPWWRDVPTWVQAVAAVLLLGVSAGLANLDIAYDASGLRVRTGWLTPAAPASIVDSRSDSGLWRAELTALEQRLRADLRPAPSPTAASAEPPTLDADTFRRVRTLVEESERRQQRELALRLGEAMREVGIQRQEDLARINRNIGAMQNTTGREMLRQRSDLLNYVAVRTAGRPQ